MNIFFNFRNKVAVMTGAGSGIGKATAIKLASLGCKLVLVGRTNKVQKVKKLINKKNIITYIGDISTEECVSKLYSKTIKEFRKVDILINSAGVTGPGNIENTSLDDWNMIHANNGTNTFLMCKYFSKIMKKKRYGKIVNVSSIAGRYRGRTSGLHYAYSKSGVIGFTRQLGAELAKWNINVNCFCPSQTMTEMLKSLINSKIKKELEITIPIKRIANPEEQANVIIFLCSNLCTYMAGAIIDSNGGQF